MNAKKLTMAVSFMMVLAAAFVLVVPSDSEAADGFEITDAEFLKGKTNYFLTATISEKVEKGVISLYYENETEPIASEVIPTGWLTLDVLVGPTLANGTYRVVVDSEFGTVTKTLTWPTVVSHNIIVTQSVGGYVETDVKSAVPGTTVNITATPDKDYRLKDLIVNGQILEKGVYSFPMPDSPVSVSAVFEKQLCTVTFVVAEGFSKEVAATVGAPMQAPAAPEIIGAEFDGWYTEDGVKFDFETEIEGDMTLYAHFGPEAPSTEQTKKFVAAMSDDCNLVLTAYDGKIIGEGSATVTVYKAQTIRGIQQYIPAGSFEVTIDSDDAFCIADLAGDVDKITAGVAGSYAVSAVVTLTNGTVQLSNYATFEINEQA